MLLHLSLATGSVSPAKRIGRHRASGPIIERRIVRVGRTHPLAPLFLLLLLLPPLLMATPARAVLTIDQENHGYDSAIQFGSIVLYVQNQSFRPTFDFLDVVGLSMTVDAGGASARIDLRDGIGGPVIASSAVVVMPGSVTPIEIEFPFSPAVSLVPESIYVIEVVPISGTAFWAADANPNIDYYPRGSMYTSGTESPKLDRWFYTGIVSAVAPQQALPGPVPIEYSNAFDEQALPAGGHGPNDAGQNLYTEPFDGPADGRPRDAGDAFPTVESGPEPDAEIDALAAGFDAGFQDVIQGKGSLLISVEGDGIPGDLGVLVENEDGSTGVLYKHDSLNYADSPGDLDDIDGLELWGDPSDDDARYFSLVGDSNHGVSVFIDESGSPAPFVSHAAVVAAVTSLGFAGAANDVDVDALMVRNAGALEEFEIGDAILFSIRGVVGSGFDGSEIVYLPNGATARFLEHGGHLWDDVFSVQSRFAFLIETEEIDALEVEVEPPSIPVPALGDGMLALLAGILVLSILRFAAAWMRPKPSP